MTTLFQEKVDSLSAFEELNESQDVSLEYIEGKIYAMASPSLAHQLVSMKLSAMFLDFFEGGDCIPITAPFDVILTKPDFPQHYVIPDLIVVCNQEGLSEKRYEGVPALIVEILSPSNQQHDLITKMNLYAKFGVSEYWIINPMNQSVSIYTLDEETGHFIQYQVKDAGTSQSEKFPLLRVDLKNLFRKQVR